MFIIYFFTIYTLTEDEDINDYLSFFIFMYFAFSLISFIIAESNFFSSPYVSILQNIVNLFSYSVSGIISFLIGLHTSHLIQLPSYSGNIFMAFIIITPILTNLITPFFAKKDPLLVPTSFNLRKIEKWDKKLNRLLNFRREQVKARNERKNKNKKKNENSNEEDENQDFIEDGILLEEEPSISLSYFDNMQSKSKNKGEEEEEEQNENYFIGQFDLLKLAPIQIQERIKNVEYDKNGNISEKYKNYKEQIKSIWCKEDIEEENFNKAAKEMQDISDRLINCISFNNLIRLFNLSIIVSSMILGCMLYNGIEQMQLISISKNTRYHTRCNMFENGTYPSYGTY